MNSALANILAAASNPDTPVAPADVVALAREYPFFTLPAVMLLRREGDTLDAELRARLMRQIALNAPDAAMLTLMSDPSLDEWRRFYPEPEKKKVTTDEVISTFLDTYGQSSPSEEALLERLIFNPTPDYSSVLAREEEASLPEPVEADDDSNDALINSFIRRQRAPQPATEPEAKPGQMLESEPASLPEQQPQPAPAPPAHTEPVRPAKHHAHAAASDTSLSESLAKIYIRQKRYDKAFEIIHALSLNNPKKSVYFADQLRFLRKLMLNRNLSNGENQ